ncbi:MAG: archaellin/type IV pilin N-terminal domain-containing protein [Nanobdellota archaeon]
MKKGMKLVTKKETKGLSPVIATVLLIVIVVIIALIVFLWVRGMTQEAITKFDNENIQLVCGKVSFEATYTSDTGLYIRNPGNVPIFGMDVQVIGPGEHETLDLRDSAVTTEWPEVGLNQGGVFSDPNFGDNIAGAEEIVLIPILMGESESGRKTYVCDENQYGYRISV